MDVAVIHEYTHLWDRALQVAKPRLWARGKELMKKLPLWDQIKNDPAYADIAGDEDLRASEVHARLAGPEGVRYLEQMVRDAKKKGTMATAEAVTLKQRILNWLRETLNWVRDAFGQWSDRDLESLTLEEFAAMPVRDLVKGVNPNEMAGKGRRDGQIVRMGKNEKKSKTWQHLSTPSNEVLALSSTYDAAKLRIIADNLQRTALKYVKSTQIKGILTNIANALGAHGRGVSKYATIHFEDGSAALIRISNHNANAATFKERGKYDGNISIVFKTMRGKNNFHPDAEVELTEYVYAKEDILRDANILSGVCESLANMIKTGKYVDLTGKAIVNRSPEAIERNYTSEAEGADQPIQFFIGKRARAQYEELLDRKRPDMPQAERRQALDYLHSLEDTKDNNRKVKVAVHWLANSDINLPNDMHTVDRALAVAAQAKVDPMAYASPHALLQAHADVKLKEKPINPDQVPTLHKAFELADGLDRIYHHAGKPWAKVTTAAVAIRMTIEDALAGREPRFNSMLMRKNKTLAKQIRKRGPEAIWRYLNERGFIGNAAKCVNDVNGSYLSCHPSDDCAEFCYACKKNYTFANSAIKSELIYWAVKKDRICTIMGKFS